MKTIIISEEKIKVLEQAVLNEKYGGLGDAVKLVKDYLDKNFARAKSTIFKDGKPKTEEVVAWLDDYKQIVKTLTDVQLFYVLQDAFQTIMTDRDERDKFLKQIIKDWYTHKITKNYSLSVY